MSYAIISGDKVVNIVEADADYAAAQGWIDATGASIGDEYIDGEFVAPSPVAVVPDEVTALQGLLALDAAGKATAYESWANSVDRTFAEKAFINKALVWRRDSETIASACAALNISDAGRDALFVLAATL